jgi:hypothetical protein
LEPRLKLICTFDQLTPLFVGEILAEVRRKANDLRRIDLSGTRSVHAELVLNLTSDRGERVVDLLGLVSVRVHQSRIRSPNREAHGIVGRPTPRDPVTGASAIR